MSIIMLFLRFFAGPIVHKFSALGLLAVSTVLEIIGLVTLSTAAAGAMIFIAATIYALGKTFFWPTMLGVVSEQTPKGGALTLNAISGIGMLAVGTLGSPYIGALQADKQSEALVQDTELASQVPGLVVNGELAALEERRIYEIITYDAVSDAKLGELVGALPEPARGPVNDKIGAVRSSANQGALANMAIFPMIMLVGYILLILYFKSRGGYKAQEL